MTVLRNLRKQPSRSGAPESLPSGRPRSSDWAGGRATLPPSDARPSVGAVSCAILLCLVLGLGAGAGAHAILVGSEPAHGAILDEPPRRVVFRFNAALERGVTRVYLVDVEERRTPLRTIDTSTDRVVVDLPPLRAGVYTIVYKVLARDGHVTEGVLRFTVRGR